MQKYRNKIPWDKTDFTSVSLQCLNIIKIIGETATGISTEVDDESFVDESCDVSDTSLSSLISATPAFGFTIGADKSILDCISQINQLQKNIARWHDDMLYQKDDFLERILSQLNSCRRRVSLPMIVEDATMPDEATENALEVLNQAKAFIHATYIYLYRTIFDSPPQNVRPYVSETLRHVDAFFETSNGNFSIWPAFIAAVEAYTNDDLAAAKRWLERSTSYGMGNRQAVRKVVEEVWQRREDMSEVAGVDRGIVIVDWRIVMKEMDYDVLLV